MNSVQIFVPETLAIGSSGGSVLRIPRTAWPANPNISVTPIATPGARGCPYRARARECGISPGVDSGDDRDHPHRTIRLAACQEATVFGPRAGPQRSAMGVGHRRRSAVRSDPGTQLAARDGRPVRARGQPPRPHPSDAGLGASPTNPLATTVGLWLRRPAGRAGSRAPRRKGPIGPGIPGFARGGRRGRAQEQSMAQIFQPLAP
jgi:hypothetical protein